MAARTNLASPTADLVARIRERLERELAWTRLERDGTPLRRCARLEAEELLLASWSDGEIHGLTPDEAFYVDCDPDGDLLLVVGVAVEEPGEFVEIPIALHTRERS